MIKQLISVLLIVLLSQCTIVSPKFLGAVGTDMDGVTYETNGETGTCKFAANTINNSKATAEVGKTARFAIGWWGTAKVAESFAKGVASMVKGKTDLAGIEAKKEVDVINANSEAEVGKIGAEAAAKEVPVVAAPN